MTYFRSIAVAAVIAAAAVTGVVLVSQQAVAAARWGSAIDVLKNAMPSSTEVTSRFKFGIQYLTPTSPEALGKFKFGRDQLLMPSSTFAGARYGG
jgi:hypothetical protein